MTILNLVSALLIAAGLVFFLGAAVGLVRFPDFYTRMHAAGKGDTLSSLLVVLGIAVHVLGGIDWSHFDWGSVLVVIKLLAICALIMLTSPTSTHALMDAGYDDGIQPVLVENGNDLERDGYPAAAGDPHERFGRARSRR